MPSEISANISDSTSIACRVTSSQHVNVTWMKDGYPLITENNMEIHETFLNNSTISLVSISTINLLVVQLSDSGWYNCTVAIANESAALSSASASVYLNIQNGPISSEQITATATNISATATTISATSGIIIMHN